MIVIFENVSPKGSFWLKMKYFEISVLAANSRYLQTAALKNGKCHDARCIHLYWLASRRRWFHKPNWLTWSEPELIVGLLFLLFYCLAVALHVHVLFPFHVFPESRFRLYKRKKCDRTPKYGPSARLAGEQEGGTPLHKLYSFVPPHRVGFLRRFWSENEYTLCQFWSRIGYGFQGNYGSGWTYLSFQFQMTH